MAPAAGSSAALAEIRNFYEAKIAEVEILHQGRLRTTFDPDERAAREEEYRRDREGLSSDRDARIEKARRGEASEERELAARPLRRTLDHVATPQRKNRVGQGPAGTSGVVFDPGGRPRSIV